MIPSERWADIIKTMRAHGWEIVSETQDAVYMGHTGRMQGLWLDDNMAAMFDAFWQRGFQYGFERGAYEEQQQEDVEPGDRDVLHTLTSQKT